MSRMKALFAVLAMAAMAALVPSASAVVTSKGQVVVSGSSALWQTIALAAFNNGGCPLAKVKVHPPCQHWTSKDSFNLTDVRPTKVKKKSRRPGNVRGRYGWHLDRVGHRHRHHQKRLGLYQGRLSGRRPLPVRQSRLHHYPTHRRNLGCGK